MQHHSASRWAWASSRRSSLCSKSSRSRAAQLEALSPSTQEVPDASPATAGGVLTRRGRDTIEAPEPSSPARRGTGRASPAARARSTAISARSRSSASLAACAERIERRLRVAGPFGGEGQAARRGTAHRSAKRPSRRCAPTTSPSNDSAISIAPLAIAASAASPLHRTIRSGMPEPVAWNASADTGSAIGTESPHSSITLSGSLMDGAPTTHRQALVRGDPAPGRGGSGRSRRRRHKIAELALPRVGLDQIQAVSSTRLASDRLIVEPSTDGVADELAARDRELIDARREQAFDGLRIGVRSGSRRARVATERASSMR